MVQRQRFEDLRDAMAPLRLSVAPSPFPGPFKGRELRRWHGDCLMLNLRPSLVVRAEMLLATADEVIQ
jgi:hypothetical protein